MLLSAMSRRQSLREMNRRNIIYKITGDASGHGWVSWSLVRHDYKGGVETESTPLVDCCEFFDADIHELEQWPTHHGLQELCHLLKVNLDDPAATPMIKRHTGGIAVMIYCDRKPFVLEVNAFLQLGTYTKTADSFRRLRLQLIRMFIRALKMQEIEVTIAWEPSESRLITPHDWICKCAHQHGNPVYRNFKSEMVVWPEKSNHLMVRHF